MGNKVLSPLNKKAKVHYRYILDSISHTSEGDLYVIQIIPRYRSTQLLEGRLEILAGEWTIRHIDVKGHYDLILYGKYGGNSLFAARNRTGLEF